MSRNPNPCNQSKKKSVPMSSCFPEDITTDILKRLPVKSLLRFRCVSKSWCSLTKTPNFVKLQLNHSLKHNDHGLIYEDKDGKLCCVDYESLSLELGKAFVHFDYPSEHKMKGTVMFDGVLVHCKSDHREEGILGSCNGLVCYVSYDKDMIIWNPYTKDYKKLPEMEWSRVSYRYGFGYYDSDYIVARLGNISGNPSELVVYSLKLNLWKVYRDIPFLFACGGLVFFEGIIHWLEEPPLTRPQQQLPKLIGCFDIASEAFKEIQLPERFTKKLHNNIVSLHLLRGCLCLVGCQYDTCSQVWMMKDYGVHESWTKMYTIDIQYSGLGYLHLEQSFKNGMILVKPDNNIPDNNRPCMYDPKHKKFIKLEINLQGFHFQTWAFLGSLVSPNNFAALSDMQQ